MESHRRSLAKALSWRILAMAITGMVAWLFTRELAFAVTIGLADSVIKIFVYYLHERTWTSIPFGRMRQPEYEI
jgi:uncharacterized membrane protein